MTNLENKPVSHEKVMITLLGFLTAFGPLSIDMYLPALPKIAKVLQTDLGHVQLSLSAFFIGLALGQLFYGPFTDRVGRKKPLYFGISIYIISSLVCAFAQNVETLIVARFFQALGSCAGVVITRAIVRDVYGHQEAARIFSVLILIMGVAPILAPLLGGYIAVNLGWTYIFHILAIFSSLCLVGIHLFLKETHPSLPGEKKKILKTYLDIMTHKQFLRNTFAGGIVQSGMFAYITGSSYVFIEIFEVKPENFGFIFGTNALGLIIFSQVNSRLLKKKSPEDILRKVFPVVALISVVMIFAGKFGTNLWHIWIPIFLFMACLGMTFPNTTAEALAEEGAHAGSASALLGTMQYSLAAMTSAIMSAFHDKSALPMTIVMGTCGILAFTIHFVTRKK